MKDRERAEELLNFMKDCLLKHLHVMKHTNNYPSEAVPKATILELPKLYAKEVEDKLIAFRNEGVREELEDFVRYSFKVQIEEGKSLKDDELIDNYLKTKQ